MEIPKLSSQLIYISPMNHYIDPCRDKLVQSVVHARINVNALELQQPRQVSPLLFFLFIRSLSVVLGAGSHKVTNPPTIYIDPI